MIWYQVYECFWHLWLLSEKVKFKYKYWWQHTEKHMLTFNKSFNMRNWSRLPECHICCQMAYLIVLCSSLIVCNCTLCVRVLIFQCNYGVSGEFNSTESGWMYSFIGCGLRYWALTIWRGKPEAATYYKVYTSFSHQWWYDSTWIFLKSCSRDRA